MGIAFVAIHLKHRGQHWVLVPRHWSAAAGSVGARGTAGTAGSSQASRRVDAPNRD
jgi:hypothetical protein